MKNFWANSNNLYPSALFMAASYTYIVPFLVFSVPAYKKKNGNNSKIHRNKKNQDFMGFSELRFKRDKKKYKNKTKSLNEKNSALIAKWGKNERKETPTLCAAPTWRCWGISVFLYCWEQAKKKPLSRPKFNENE